MYQITLSGGAILVSAFLFCDLDIYIRSCLVEKPLKWAGLYSYDCTGCRRILASIRKLLWLANSWFVATVTWTTSPGRVTKYPLKKAFLQQRNNLFSFFISCIDCYERLQFIRSFATEFLIIRLNEVSACFNAEEELKRLWPTSLLWGGERGGGTQSMRSTLILPSLWPQVMNSNSDFCTLLETCSPCSLSDSPRHSYLEMLLGIWNC